MPNSELIEQLPNKTGSDYLRTALAKALEVLKKDENNEEDIVQGIKGSGTEESVEQYAKIFSEIAEDFEGLFGTLESMRSSYLPYEFVADTITSAGEAESITELSSEESIKESYENAFFRMLGMPSTADLGDSDELFCVKTNGKTERLNKRTYENFKLDQRQVAVSDRDTSINIDFYNTIIQDLDPIQALVDSGYDSVGDQGDNSNSKKLTKILESLKALCFIDTKNSAEAESKAAEVNQLVEDSKFPKDQISEIGQVKYDASLDSFSKFIASFKETDSTSEDNDFVLTFKSAVENIIILINPGFNFTKSNLDEIFSKYILGQEENRVTGLHSAPNFWRFSSLLFPAVQDGRIGSCINEPEKLVAEPFLPVTKRTVNGKAMRSSLLEAVLRIRLDIVTGTTKLRVRDFSSPAISIGNNNPNGITYDDIAENYGILESYLVTRLFNSFSGIAKFAKDKVKEMQIQQTNTGVVPVGTDLKNAGDIRLEKESDDRKKLNSLKVIDDSMLLLLGDSRTNKAIDFQENVSRNSSVIDAHFMKIVTTAVTYPSKWTDKKIKQEDSRNGEGGRGDLDKDRGGLDRTFGSSRGVGIIDIMSFIIAMFSVEERVLISLLNERQFGYLKSEFPQNFFKGFDRVEISVAVNELSEAAYDAYELFRTILSEENKQGLFVYSD